MRSLSFTVLFGSVMFRRKKLVLALTSAERRLLTSAVLSFRNKLLAGGKPTEDVNELLIRLMK